MQSGTTSSNGTASATVDANGLPAALILNITELARGFKLDRGTVMRKLAASGIQPFERRAQEVLYLVDETLTDLLFNTSVDYDSERLRKISAEADIKELQAQEAQGLLAPVAEFQEAVQSLFGGLHKEVVMRLPRRIGARISRAKTTPAIITLLQRELDQIFSNLREDFTKYLVDSEGKKGKKGQKAAGKTEKGAENVVNVTKNVIKEGR